jgi:hypothetical protein
MNDIRETERLRQAHRRVALVILDVSVGAPVEQGRDHVNIAPKYSHVQRSVSFMAL